jgi:hypothetical protein
MSRCLALLLLLPGVCAADGHWAFQPPRRPALPAVRQHQRIANPIDAFVLAKLEAKGLTLSAPADRATLLRRVSFTLTGLPPTAEELAAFLKDLQPGAYERAVDRLLASPRYGERWAQHWLDLARFAETDGFEHDKVRPQAWKYRDWVIAALNADLPYDDFVRQQVAGDLGSGFGVQGSANPKSQIQNLKSKIPNRLQFPPPSASPGPTCPTLTTRLSGGTTCSTN